MNDERSYDEIQGPNRLKEMFEQKLSEYAQKGKARKNKQSKKSHNYSSFATLPSAPVTFDNTLTREQAMKPYLQIPEGAPFWKYNVKDDVVTVPIKSYNFSKNSEGGHKISTKQTEQQQCLHEISCGRIKRRLEALKYKYEDLYEYEKEDRYTQVQAEEKKYLKMLKEMETAAAKSGQDNTSDFHQFTECLVKTP